MSDHFPMFITPKSFLRVFTTNYQTFGILERNSSSITAYLALYSLG
jgi:hypothetical protein